MRLKDGTQTDDQRLDRLVQFDERSRHYAAVKGLDSAATLRNRSYRVGSWLDQGTEGACVGFAFTHELVSSPVRVKDRASKDAKFARERVYWEAQRIDPWPGGVYPDASPRYEGTSVLAGAQTLKSLGYYNEYRWAFGEEDLALAVGNLGPAVIGVNWYEGMYDANQHGYIEPTGRLVGGHAIMVTAVNIEPYGAYRLWNSWGKDWGTNKRGWAWITRQNMAKLLSQDGDACIPLTRNS